MKPTNPILDYFGGKWAIADKIIAQFPAHKTYCEPFCGAASVMFRKPPAKNEVINDLHGDVVNLFRVLRESRVNLELRRRLELTPYARAEYEQSQAALSGDADGLCPIERARFTLIRSCMGIGNSLDAPSGFRVSVTKNGPITTPWRNMLDALPYYIERIGSVTVENRDYSFILDTYDAHDTLFYIDPPYISATRATKCGYRHEWTDADHVALVDRIQTLKGAVFLSGYRHPLYDVMGWDSIEFKAQSQQGERTEVLWFNRPRQRSLFD